MDHAARVIERLAIDRKAGMAGRLEDVEEIGERDVYRHRHNVRTRHHDVVHPLATQAQYVLEHRALFGREARFLLGPVALEDLGEVLPDGGRGLEPERDLDAVEEAVAMRFVRLVWRAGTSIVSV
jgi:hypothetical protein